MLKGELSGFKPVNLGLYMAVVVLRRWSALGIDVSEIGFGQTLPESLLDVLCLQYAYQYVLVCLVGYKVGDICRGCPIRSAHLCRAELWVIPDMGVMRTDYNLLDCGSTVIERSVYLVDSCSYF